MENILEKASGFIGSFFVNSAAITSATLILASGKGSPTSTAYAFAVYATIKRMGDLGGKEIGREFDAFLRDKYGFDVDKFVNDNIDKFNQIYPLKIDPSILEHPWINFEDLGGMINNNDKILDPFKSPFILPEIYDPIALDLDGDGVETRSIKDGVYFDHNSDKIAHKSSWIDKDDGLLVYDINSNNQIDNGSELFGNFTKILNTNDDTQSNSNKTIFAINGYQALRALNSNNDSVIDINDKEFNNIKVWQDLNTNGKVDEKELKSLNELDIKSLDLEFSNTDKDLGNGNELILQGSYTKKDDTTHIMGDINFSIDDKDSKFTNTIPTDTSVSINIKGIGSLRDLNQAISLSSDLKELALGYQTLATKDEQLYILPNLIKEWAKTSNEYSEYELNLRAA